MSQPEPFLTQNPPMGSPAPVHGAPQPAGPPPQYHNPGMAPQYVQAVQPAQYVQAGTPAQYVQAGSPAQYAQPVVIQQGYQQPAPHIIHVVTQPPRPPRVYDNYRARQSVILGAIQITVGSLSIVLNIIGITLQTQIQGFTRDNYQSDNGPYDNISFYQAYGIWCAIFYILAGCFAISAAKKKTKCPVIANMVLSIFAAVFVWVHISWAAAGVGLDASHPRTVYSYSYFGSYTYSNSQWSTIQGSLALSCIMLIIGVLEFVVAVWSSTLACRVTCCGNTGRPRPYVASGTQLTYAQYPGQPLGAGVAYTGAPAQPLGAGAAYTGAPAQPLGAGAAYTGAPAQPIGPGVAYNTAPAQPYGQMGNPSNGSYDNTAMAAPPAYTEKQ